MFAPDKIPEGVRDESVLFLGDIHPPAGRLLPRARSSRTTSWPYGAPAPVGQFAILSAKIMGAQRRIAIDNVVERLAMAKQVGASPLNLDTVNVVEAPNELTNGKGPDKCIDAVGLEAHATASLDSAYDPIK